MQSRICPRKNSGVRLTTGQITYFRKGIGQVIKGKAKLKEVQSFRRNKVHCLDTRHLFATKRFHAICIQSNEIHNVVALIKFLLVLRCQLYMFRTVTVRRTIVCTYSIYKEAPEDGPLRSETCTADT